MFDLGPELSGRPDAGVLTPRSTPSTPITGLRVFYSQPSEAESTVQIAWQDPGIGGTTKILRQIVPVVKLTAASGFETHGLPELPMYGWKVIGTQDSSHSGYFVDKDIPAVNESVPKGYRRSLGGLIYAYMVQVSSGERIAESPEIYTRIRGINRPRIESVSALSESEVRVRWRDNSKLANGFQVRFFVTENGQHEGRITINGTSRLEQTISGLTPDTEYLVTVRAWDHIGSSEEDDVRVRTLPAHDSQPGDMTYTLSLDRQQISEGFIPYLGRFPTSGSLPSGTLRQVSLNSAWPALLFVKPGRSTADCGDPSAVVELAPGASLTSDEMTTLYGSETPQLPIVFLACAGATSTLYNYIPIKIVYRPV